jgi:acetyl esterase/lipase
MSSSVLFLLVSLWGAWFSWNALRPTHSGPRIAVVSFAAGWLTSELALHHLAWQAVATVGFAWAGALGAWPGQLGLLITAASWGALVAAHRRSLLAGNVAERALRSALGDEFPELPQSGRTIDWKRVALPFPIRVPGVEKIANIEFARAAGVDLQLDVYRPVAAPSEQQRGAPVLLQIHGGGWVMGDKREQALPLMYQMSSRGWICVSANYRLSPHATFPDHLIDCKRALAWIREHIADYGGDPDFVVVTGGSAGGHLAALVALTANDAEYQPGFESVDTRVQACVPFYGVYDFTNRNQTLRNDGLSNVLERQVMKGALSEIPEAYDRASPIARVHSDAPSFFAIHGDSDTLVPVGEAREFVRALAEKSRQPVAYAEIPGAQHAFELFPSARTLSVNESVGAFLEWAYRRYQNASA